MGRLKKRSPRAWYETLSTYLFDNGFQRGKIDKTIFIKRHKGDILLVQVYVDDIIFGSTKKELCNAFEKLMHEKFQMSSMEELAFFLGLQVHQKKDGIFISQDKYVDEILKKFRLTEVKTTSTPMETQKPLLKDESGEEVDVHMYRLMIGSLMYLKSSRPDIMFAVCACARYQVNPKISHLHAVKRIFRKSTTREKAKKSVRLMMEKMFGMELELMLVTQFNAAGHTLTTVELLLLDGKEIVITDSFVRRDLQLADEEGIDCLPNSTIFENLAFMGPKTTGWNEFSSAMASAIICLATNQKFNFSKLIFDSMIRNLDNVSSKFLMYPRKPKRKDTQVPQSSGPTDIIADEVVHKELGDRLVRAATTAFSLEAEQDSGNINKTQSKATPNESSSLETTSGGGPRCQETMGDTIAQTRFENVSTQSYDPLLVRGNTLRSGEDSLKLIELMEFYTNLQQRVLGLEDELKQTKTTHNHKVAKFKKRVKKLKKRTRSRTYRLKRLHKVGMSIRVVFSNNEESLGEDASKQGRIDADAEMYDVGTVTGDEVFVEQEVAAKDLNLTVDEVTLAQALATLKCVKPKVIKNVIEEPNVPINAVSASTKVSATTTTTAIIPTLRKGIIIIKLGIPTITRSSPQP
ncbi:uncharacterized mitochondrial protein-like protein [Tanacetum coccineum]